MLLTSFTESDYFSYNPTFAFGRFMTEEISDLSIDSHSIAISFC